MGQEKSQLKWRIDISKIPKDWKDKIGFGGNNLTIKVEYNDLRNERFIIVCEEGKKRILESCPEAENYFIEQTEQKTKIEEIKKYSEMNDEERSEMWNEIADYLAIPEDERKPATNKELYEKLGIPERTFYWKLQEEEFMRLVVRKSLIKAKKFLPKVLKVLQKNAEEGKERSIEMFMEYAGELSKKVDLTSKGEKIQQTILELTDDQKKRIAEETLHYAKKQHDNRTIGDSEQQGTPDSVLSDDGQALPSELASSSVSGSVGAGGEGADQAFDRPDAPAPREESAQ